MILRKKGIVMRYDPKVKSQNRFEFLNNQTFPSKKKNSDL